MQCQHDERFGCGQAINIVEVIGRTGTRFIIEPVCQAHTDEYTKIWDNDLEPKVKQFLHLHVAPIGVKI